MEPWSRGRPPPGVAAWGGPAATGPLPSQPGWGQDGPCRVLGQRQPTPPAADRGGLGQLWIGSREEVGGIHGGAAWLVGPREHVLAGGAWVWPSQGPREKEPCEGIGSRSGSRLGRAAPWGGGALGSSRGCLFPPVLARPVHEAQQAPLPLSLTRWPWEGTGEGKARRPPGLPSAHGLDTASARRTPATCHAPTLPRPG